MLFIYIFNIHYFFLIIHKLFYKLKNASFLGIAQDIQLKQNFKIKYIKTCLTRIVRCLIRRDKRRL